MNTVLWLAPKTVYAATDEDCSEAKLRDLGVLIVDCTGDEKACSVPIAVDLTSMPITIPEPHKTLFAQAAAAYNVNPQYIAALFLTENGNVWKPFDTKWASSPKGASGPFQFMPGTWSGSKVDGNNDGVEDVNNIYDAAFSAANLTGKGSNVSTPLGNLEKPFTPGTLLHMAAAYNWGGGNVSRKTNPDSPLSAAPKETQDYLSNIYTLITSGFTKSGKAEYGDPRLPGASSPPASAPIIGCSGGVVAGNVVKTALGLAWDTPGHGPNKEDARPEYQVAMPKYNGSVGEDPFSDCGVFVATVMIASGADPEYPKRGTAIQLPYLRSHPEKYDIFEDINETSQLQPGDILIFSDTPYGHTYIYAGSQQGGNFNSVGASWHGHVPEATNAGLTSRGNHFTVARLK